MCSVLGSPESGTVISWSFSLGARQGWSRAEKQGLLGNEQGLSGLGVKTGDREPCKETRADRELEGQAFISESCVTVAQFLDLSARSHLLSPKVLARLAWTWGLVSVLAFPLLPR